MQLGKIQFDEVWLLDYEFMQPEGWNPKPVCMVATEYVTGHTIRLFQEELAQCGAMPPYAVSPRSVVVAYYAIAELACHLLR